MVLDPGFKEQLKNMVEVLQPFVHWSVPLLLLRVLINIYVKP
jgi:hypothetical protein